MPPSQIIAFSNTVPGGGLNNGVTRALVPLNTLNADNLASEEFTELPVREAGVFDHGYVRIESNSLDGSSTLNVRKSRTDGSVTVTVPAATAGTFEDLVNSVSVASADELNWKIVSGGSSGLINAKILGLRFTPDDANVTICWAFSGGSGGGISANNTTRFIATTGTIDVQANVDFAKARINGAFTCRDLTFHVASNARTTDVTVRTWINGSAGNQIVTIPAGATGVFSDTTHTDTLSPGDDFCYAITTLGGGGLINTRRISTTLVSANRQWIYAAGNINGAQFSPSIGGNSVYVPFAGNLNQAVTVEGDAQVATFAQRVSKLTAFVSANNLTNASCVVRTRIAGSDGNLSLAISGGSTGLFEDTTHEDVITDGQLTNLEVEFTAVGIPSGSITFRNMTLLAATDEPGGGQPAMKRWGGVPFLGGRVSGGGSWSPRRQ